MLCSIVLVGLALPLPNIAINVIKIVSGNIGDAVELEEVGFRGQSPEQRQQPPHKHRGMSRSEAVKTRQRDESRSSLAPFMRDPVVYCGRPALYRKRRRRALVSPLRAALAGGHLAPPAFEGPDSIHFGE